MSILSDLIEKKICVEEAALMAIKDGKILSEFLEGILSKHDEVRFNSYHVLLNISEYNPEILYPKWDYRADLLKSNNHYIRISLSTY